MSGPVAADILENFLDRWEHQGGEQQHLLELREGLDMAAAGDEEEGQGGPWTVQVTPVY